jgi:hypothetical protein
MAVEGGSQFTRKTQRIIHTSQFSRPLTRRLIEALCVSISIGGRVLYKYLPTERIDVINSGNIRFTPLLSLNDPFEYSLLIGKEEYALDPSVVRSDSEPTSFISLSRNRSNILMWSHYADSHRGFCIGFNRNHKYFSRAEPIRYRKFRSSLNGLKSQHSNSSNILKDVALEKAIDWAYEEEERLFLCDVNQNLTRLGVDDWGQNIVLNSYPFDAISEIIIGLRADTSFANKLKEALDLHGLSVPIYKAVKSKTEFGLEFKTIIL